MSPAFVFILKGFFHVFGKTILVIFDHSKWFENGLENSLKNSLKNGLTLQISRWYKWLRFRVCLVRWKSGRKEIGEGKFGWKLRIVFVWQEGKVEGKENKKEKIICGAHNFLSSQNWKEKWREIFLPKQSKANYSFVYFLIF